MCAVPFCRIRRLHFGWSAMEGRRNGRVEVIPYRPSSAITSLAVAAVSYLPTRTTSSPLSGTEADYTFLEILVDDEPVSNSPMRAFCDADKTEGTTTPTLRPTTEPHNQCVKNCDNCEKEKQSLRQWSYGLCLRHPQ